MFVYVKQFYQMGLYSVTDLATFKAAAMITPAQYDELTTKTAAA